MVGSTRADRSSAPAPRIVARLAEVRAWADSLDRFLPWLSAVEHARFDALRKPSSRLAYLLAHVLLRLAVAEATGEAPAALGVATPAGLPPSVPARPGLSLSLAHTDGLAAVAVAGGTSVGIDVEREGDAALADEIADAVLTAGERAALESLPLEQRGPALTRAWVRKEAVLKAAAVGLTVAPNLVETGIDAASLTPRAVAIPASLRLPAFVVADLAAPAGYRGALAWRAIAPAPAIDVVRREPGS